MHIEPPEENTTVMKRLSFSLLVGTVGFGAGCGSAASTPPPYKDCGKDGFICNPPGFPFVVVAGAVSDSCGGLVAECAPFATPPAGATTARLTQPVMGKICLSGTVEAGGWAAVVLPCATVTEDGNTFLTSLERGRSRHHPMASPSIHR